VGYIALKFKNNEKVKENRYILRKLIDAIKFCGAFELALRGHDEGVESNNPGIFRGLINLIAEVDDILKLHIDQYKNAVFTGTDMDIDSNKKVLGTIRIDRSVPSLSIWSRAATGVLYYSSLLNNLKLKLKNFKLLSKEE
jgi:hypothetical protein